MPIEMKKKDSAERILDAGAELFGSQGYGKTTMAEIAECAHVSKGLPYVYFPSKQELLDAVLVRSIHRWSENVAARLSIGEEPALESLRKSFKYSVLYASEDPICRAIMAEDAKVVSPNSEKLRAEIVRLNEEGFVRLLEQLQKEKLLQPKLPLTDVLTLWRIAHDALVHIQTDSLSWGSTSRPLEEVVDNALVILLEGIIRR